MEFPFFFGLKVREGFESRRLAAVFTQSLQLDLMNELTLQASSKVKSQYVPTLWSKISKLPKSPSRGGGVEFFRFDEQTAAVQHKVDKTSGKQSFFTRSLPTTRLNCRHHVIASLDNTVLLIDAPFYTDFLLHSSWPQKSHSMALTSWHSWPTSLSHCLLPIGLH